MNEITKELVQRILDLKIEGVEHNEDGLRHGRRYIISKSGDVNYSGWHKTTLKHDYFRFTDFGNVHIETQEQANEFYEIVCNYFGVKPKTKTYAEKQEELNKEYLQPLADQIEGCYVERYSLKVDGTTFAVLLDDGRLSILGRGKNYFETPDYTQIEKVVVKKPFNVVEELCKIEFDNKCLEIKKRGLVKLSFNSTDIACILNTETRTINYTDSFTSEDKKTRQKKFGLWLKQEQEKEFVEWVAKALGGTYNG